MKSKTEIYGLINQGNLFEAFEELNKYFQNENNMLNDLQQQFINPPNNFSMALFTGRLKSFVGGFYKESSLSKIEEKPVAVDYELLCALNFKLQATNFKVYKYKKVAAFLLHGESDDEGNDLKWLCNQMLYHEKLLQDKHIIIDLSSKMGGSFERLLEEFYVSFNIDTSASARTKPIVALRGELEERLKTGPLVCVIKSPDDILGNETDMCKLYDDFLAYMHLNINQKNHENPLVILFVNNKVADIKCLGAKYFFWFDEHQHIQYLNTARHVEEMRIIDLAPVQKIKEKDIRDWIMWSVHKQEMFDKTSLISGREKEMLQNGDSPLQVIKQICNELNIKFQDKWIN